MKWSRRDLSINTVIDCFIFKNSQITPFPVLSSYPKTGMGLSETGIIFSVKNL